MVLLTSDRYSSYLVNTFRNQEKYFEKYFLTVRD